MATNPKINPLQTQTLNQAWAVYDSIMLSPKIAFAVEPNGLEAFWRQWTQLVTFSLNVWNDAYLAAFCMAGNFELVTFDKGFSQFKNLRLTILT